MEYVSFSTSELTIKMRFGVIILLALVGLVWGTYAARIHKTPLPPICGCKREAPFCASTGETFWSKCEMMCGYPENTIGRYKVHDGPCLPERSGRQGMRTQHIDPICGCIPVAPFCASTGETFWSECEMMCNQPENIVGRYKVHDGPCLPERSGRQGVLTHHVIPPCGCIAVAPFCASTGETFWSECEMLCGYGPIPGRYKVHDGPC